MITPLLFFIIFMIIEAAPMFLLWSSNQDAAEEGARTATVAGRSGSADFDILRSMRTPLGSVGVALDYIIVFRAGALNSSVPIDCVRAAESAIASGAPSDQAVGFFKRADSGLTMTTGEGQDVLSGFDWVSTRPAIACNVYRRESLSATIDRFQYRSDAPKLSLDRFWPANKRNDSISSQDLVGVYVRSKYRTISGIFPSRIVENTRVGIVEARRVR